MTQKVASLNPTSIAVLELLKNEVIFNKPIYIAMAILNISKTTLYQFRYNYVKDKYRDACKFC